MWTAWWRQYQYVCVLPSLWQIIQRHDTVALFIVDLSSQWPNGRSSESALTFIEGTPIGSYDNLCTIVLAPLGSYDNLCVWHWKIQKLTGGVTVSPGQKNEGTWRHGNGFCSDVIRITECPLRGKPNSPPDVEVRGEVILRARGKPRIPWKLPWDWC